MEVGVRLLGAGEVLLSWLLAPLLIVLSRLRGRALPAAVDPLLTIPAVRLADMIRNRQVSCQAVVSAYVRRLETVNPSLNAVVEERYTAALEEARALDAKLADPQADLDSQLPFLGVPFTVKESCALKDMSQSVGSRSRAGERAIKDGEAVSRLRAAGGIPLAVTNTPELCLCWETDNLITGRTCNPYNTWRTPGGSSGGEGALLGAAGSVIGVGSDIAGSIRIPSMFCGVFGHKPSPGYIPVEGHVPTCDDNDLSKYMVVGPMARYAEDLVPLVKVMSGPMADQLRLDEKVNISDLTIFYKYDSGFSLVTLSVEKSIIKAINEAKEYFKTEFSCKTVKADFSELIESVEISISVFLGMNGIPSIIEGKGKETKQGVVVELVKSLFGGSKYSYQGLLFALLHQVNMFIPRGKFPHYNHLADSLRQTFKDTLGDKGVLLYPTFPVEAFLHHEFTIKTAGVMYAMIFNILGLPATHVPMGLNERGLPVGFQVVAGPGQDRLCLAVAKALQDKFGGWKPPPS